MSHTPLPWLAATFRNAIDSFARHRLPRQAATLAYYTLFSLAPLLVIALVISGSLLGDGCDVESLGQVAQGLDPVEECVESTVFDQLASLVGEEMASTVESLVTAQQNLENGGSLLATVVGSAVLFVGASGMFQALQDALNTVWDIPISEVRGLIRSLIRRVIRDRSIGSNGFSPPCTGDISKLELPYSNPNNAMRFSLSFHLDAGACHSVVSSS